LNGKAPDENYLSFLKKRMLSACDSIENIWLKDKLFITGQEISIADLLAAAELEQLCTILYLLQFIYLINKKYQQIQYFSTFSIHFRSNWI
jgi:hypothetical protein